MLQLLRVLALALLCASASAQTRPGSHMAHASARAGVQKTPIRGDYIGNTLYSTAACTNALTCSPSQCKKGANIACTVVNAQGGSTNSVRRVTRVRYAVCPGARSPFFSLPFSVEHGVCSRPEPSPEHQLHCELGREVHYRRVDASFRALPGHLGSLLQR